MPHHAPLIGTIVAGIVVAFAMGAVAHRIRISPVAGYLLAGVLIGPFTPGIVADGGLANQLAELGVILLMFGVGLHFSLRDLLAVRKIAVPGAIVQITVATGLGLALALGLGWPVEGGLVFGLALSVASTVVLLRAMQNHKLLDTEQGRIAVGWLVVEDLAMVVAIVLLPVFASFMSGGEVTGRDVALTLGQTALKVAGFVALMLLVGKRLIPAVLHWAAHSGSRELFRLSVLAIALGVAFGAAFVFDVSFALGAFFAGMILGETPLSRRAAEETLPLRDAFAVLFFVSVGMLFDPAVIVEQPGPLMATLVIILLGKSLAAFAIVRFAGYTNQTALTVSVSLAQIGEFSFILASLSGSLGLLPPEARDLILGGAILSILANPLLFKVVVDRFASVPASPAGRADVLAAAVPQKHLVLVGYGMIGRLVAAGLKARGAAFVLVEDQEDIAREARENGVATVIGNAAEPEVLQQAGIDEAAMLVVAIPEGFEAGGIVERARGMNAGVRIIARAHSDVEARHLKTCGADRAILGEDLIAERMLALAAQARGGA